MIYSTHDTPGVLAWKKDINSVYTNVNKTCSNIFGFNKIDQMMLIKNHCKYFHLHIKFISMRAIIMNSSLYIISA